MHSGFPGPLAFCCLDSLSHRSATLKAILPARCAGTKHATIATPARVRPIASIRYGFRVAVHRPSARPSTLMRPPAESPSNQPASVAAPWPWSCGNFHCASKLNST